MLICFFVVTVDQSTMVDSDELQKEMDLQDRWVHKPRTYEQKEADQRNLVDQKLKEYYVRAVFILISLFRTKCPIIFSIYSLLLNPKSIGK